MAVTLTIPELTASLRLSADDTAMPNAPLSGMLTRHLEVATAEVEGYAPAAPVATQNEAVVRMVGWLWEASPTMQGNPFIHSGARALLSRWHSLVVAPIGAALTPITPSPHVLQVIGGLSANDTPEASELTIAPVTPGIIPFPVFDDRHVLIWKPASDGLLTSIVFRDDSTKLNVIGAWTQWPMAIIHGHLVGNVWVSNQLLTFTVARELEAS